MSELMDILSPVLGDKLAKAIIDHRIAKKAKLTPYAAELQVKEYLKTGNPVAAAEMQLLHGWQAIKANWYFKEIEKDSRSARRAGDMADFGREALERFYERESLPSSSH